MRILFVADGRSAIAINWIRYFVDRGDEVHLVSLYPCHPELELASLHHIPIALSAAVKAGSSEGNWPQPLSRALRRLASPRLRTALRQRLVPGSLTKAAAELSDRINNLQPDLIHAMRIPYEGMVAAIADPAIPLLISVWGNDFTLHAASTPRMRELTRLAMVRAAALHTDCWRDRRLATEWGFEKAKPAVVLPGGGGVQADIFYPQSLSEQALAARLADPIYLNPRGLRAYVRNQAFFQAIPLVLEKIPAARFICTGMAGEAEPARWLRQYGGGQAVQLLPPQSRPEMAELFRQASVAVSPSVHDGTPNTLLEAMACGCYILAGDLESLREWIEPGRNGILVNPEDPDALAEGMVSAVSDPPAFTRARAINQQLIAEKGDYAQVMAQAANFYQNLAVKPSGA